MAVVAEFVGIVEAAEVADIAVAAHTKADEEHSGEIQVVLLEVVYHRLLVACQAFLDSRKGVVGMRHGREETVAGSVVVGS